MDKPAKTNGHKCTICGNVYDKRDFHVCPHCGGDGGGISQKVWRPNKREKKAYAKKMKNKL